MKKQIIAIGGGAMSRSRDHFPIEQYILEQSPKENPKVCFMATATNDANENIHRFYDVFGKFKCERTHLALSSRPRDIKKLVLTQDIIYVGGGNTRNLLESWQEWHLDTILLEAWHQGAILSGFSAGSICWFEEGLSDYIPSELNPIRALGFLKGSHCPHYDSELKRRPRYRELISKGMMKDGIAAEDDVALHFVDQDLHRIVSARRHAKAYKVKRGGDSVEEEALKPDLFV